ncbi:MAG: cytochrome C [Gammaproteobacteria bacterium]|nr:cytochrome C [Gammaproteobacteria bacterium]
MALTAAILFAFSACSEQPLQAPIPPAKVKPTPDDWNAYQLRKMSDKAEYIENHQSAFNWFADFAFSQNDGVPYIILRLLPEVAPEIWGSDENFLDVVGLFNDQRQAGYPMPRGIGISALARNDPFASIDYTSFTCAACHIGRVLLDDGRTRYIDGGVNSEFNIVLYRVKVYQTLQKLFGSETDRSKKNELVIDGFLQALDRAQQRSPTFFYQGYKNDWVNFDAKYEAGQIDLFKKTAAELIANFATHAEQEYLGYAALVDKNYADIRQRSLQGFPGMADATGISTVNGYIGLRQKPLTKLFASIVLPKAPGITDFMSVWEQGQRKAEWDDGHRQLINGGGQWNGNIPIPMYRNMAAQLTLGLNDNDLRVSAFGVELLDGLPASVYPFEVDINLAKKGQELFAENCAQCHQPHNGRVYDNLNVNLDRSYVVSWIIRKGGVDGFFAQCSPDTELNLDGKAVKPCAEFDGISLQGKKQLIMSPNKSHHGYNARPLSGIWAQAPYLHTGSVPTVYHLLVPEERPDSFIKSRLEYDKKMLGFAWQEDYVSANRNASVHSYLFDTRSFETFSKNGHDEDIVEDGKIYKLDWSDDRAGAWALIEYLKTL